MKKITLLLILLPLFGFSQTFEFNNSDDGWNLLNGFTSQTNDTYYTLTTLPGDGALKNPSVGNSATGVNTEEVHWVGITLRNNDENGPTLMRVSYPKDKGRVYKNIKISAGDTDFKVYWIDLSNSHWVGIMNDIKLHFKTYSSASNGGVDYILPDTPVSLDIDKIQFASKPQTTLQNAYYFDTDGDAEGFVAKNGEIEGVEGGKLTFVPEADKYAKLMQIYHHVDADANKYVHITLKNYSSQNAQLRFLKEQGGAIRVEMTTNDTEEKTYTINLSQDSTWFGDQMFSIGIGGGIVGNDTINTAIDDGKVEFYSIVFDNSVGVEDVKSVNFSIYPNPANQVFTINSDEEITSLIVFDITGKKVLDLTGNVTKQVSVSDLQPGIYMVKANFSGNKEVTKRLVISR